MQCGGGWIQAQGLLSHGDNTPELVKEVRLLAQLVGCLCNAFEFGVVLGNNLGHRFLVLLQNVTAI